MGSFRSPRSLVASGLCVCAVLLVAAPAGRRISRTPPAHIAFVEGAASLDRDGQTETRHRGVPFVSGDRAAHRPAAASRSCSPMGRLSHVDAVHVGRSAVADAAPRHRRARPADGRRRRAIRRARSAIRSTRRWLGHHRRARRVPRRAAHWSRGPEDRARGASWIRRAFNRTRCDRRPRRRADAWRATRTRRCARRSSTPPARRVRSLGEARRSDRTRTTASTQYLPDDLHMYGSTFDRNGRGGTNPPTGTCGIHPSHSTGARTTTATGRRSGRTAGPGSVSTPGGGRRITTADGATRAISGSGFPSAAGPPAWVSWALRPATSAGVRSASTTVRSSA